MSTKKYALRKNIPDKNSEIRMNEINSHYRLDYILAQFDQYINEEIADPEKNALNNVYFKQFMKLVSSLRKNVDKSRNSDDPEVSSKYAMSDPVDISDYRRAITRSIDIMATHIMDGDKIKYYPVPPDIGGPRGEMEFYFKVFSPTDGTDIDSSLDEIIDTWKEYQTSLTEESKPEENPFKEMLMKLDQNTRNMMDGLVSEDYGDNYETVEKLLNNSVDLISRVSSNSFVEAQIIKTINITNDYENLIFTESDIPDIAVIIPGDPVDLVTNEEMKKTITEKVEAIKYKISGKDISRMFGFTNTKSKSKSSQSVLQNALDSIEQQDQTQKVAEDLNAHQLMEASIYKKIPTKPAVAEYLTPEEEDKLTAQEVKKQNKILNAIGDSTVNHSLFATYQVNYPPKSFHTGGGSKQKSLTFEEYELRHKTLPKKKSQRKYQFKKSKTYSVTSQVGGHKVDITDYKSKAVTQNAILNLIDTTTKSDLTTINNLNKGFYNNKEKFDLKRLEQKNELLLILEEMITIKHFVNNLENNDYNKFYRELNKKIINFDKKISELWDVSHSRVKLTTDLGSDEALGKVLNEASLTTTNLQDFIKSQGFQGRNIDFDTKLYPNEITFNNMPMSVLIDKLMDEWGSIDRVADFLQSAIKGSSVQTQSDSIDKLQELLQSDISNVKNISNTMKSVQQMVITNSDDINTYISGIKEIIDTNISTANLYIVSLLKNISVYDNVISSYSKLVFETHKTKNRIENFNIYMDTIVKIADRIDNTPGLYNAEQTEIDDVNSDTLELNIAELIKSYKDYATNYKKIVANLVPNITADLQLSTINKYLRNLSTHLENIMVLSYTIFLENKTPKLYFPITSNKLIGETIESDINYKILSINYLSKVIGGLSSNNNNLKKGNMVKTLGSGNIYDLIYSTMKYLFMDNFSLLVIYPDLVNRLDISIELQHIINNFVMPSPVVLIALGDNILKRITIKEGIDKIINLTNLMYEQTIRYLSAYAVLTGDPIDDNYINTLYQTWTNIEKNKKYMNNDYSDIVLLITGLKELYTKYPVPEDFEIQFKKSTFQYLKQQKIYNKSLTAYISGQINNLFISIYQIFYQELFSYYGLLSVGLANDDKYIPKAYIIKNKMEKLTALNFNIQKLKFIEYTYTINDKKEFLEATRNLLNRNYYPEFDSFMIDYMNNSKIPREMVDILIFFKNIPSDKLIKLSRLDEEIKFEPLGKNKLYEILAKKINGTNIDNAWDGKTILTTNLLDKNISSFKAIDQYIPTAIKNYDPISFKIIDNKQLTPELLDKFILFTNTLMVSIDIFPELLRLKTKLADISDDTLLNKIITGPNVNVDDKNKLRNDLIKYLTDFEKKIDHEIRSNVSNILPQLADILFEDITLFEQARLLLRNVNYKTEIIPAAKLSFTWNFLTDMVNWYISYIYLLLQQLFNLNILYYIDDVINKQKLRLNIDTSSIIDTTELFEFVADISEPTLIILNRYKNIVDKELNERKLIAIEPSPPKDNIYDYYYDNIDATKTIIPYFEIATLSNNEEFIKNLSKLNNVSVYIGQLDMFSRDLNIQGFWEDFVNAKAIDNTIRWDNKEQAEKQIAEIRAMFKNYYYNSNGPRKTYVESLKTKKPYPEIDAIREEISGNSYRWFGTSPDCFTTGTYDKYTSEKTSQIQPITDFMPDYTGIRYADMTALSPWDSTKHHTPISHDNLGNILANHFKDKITYPINLFLRNVLAILYYEYVNSIRVNIEKYIDDLVTSLVKNNYPELANAIIDYVGIVLNDNDTLNLIKPDINWITYIGDKYDAIPKIGTINNTSKVALNFILKNGNKDDWSEPKFSIKTVSAFSTLKMLSTNVKTIIADNFEIEKNNIQKIISLDYELKLRMVTDKKNIIEKQYELKELMSIISRIMFQPYFINEPFLGSDLVLEHVSRIGKTYEQISTALKKRLYSIIDTQSDRMLDKSRQANYTGFLALMGKQIGEEKKTKKVYKQMSFTLIELYRDIIKIILDCINEKPHRKLSPLNAYLSECHYIVLNRCYKLFDWIIREYLPPKIKQNEQEQISDMRKPVGERTYDGKTQDIMRKKLQLLSTSGDAQSIFIEFNSVKEYIDKYKTLVMPPVSVYLRINDWEIKPHDTNNPTYNDYDARSIEYYDLYKNKKLVFSNDDESAPNKLKVYAENIPIKQGADPATYHTDITERYQSVFKTVQDKGGIEFQKILNSRDFPEPDVIANQMSTGPLLSEGKGIMLVTYGYSGVGKSSTLFGVIDKTTGDLQIPGMLQSTLDQLPSGSDIYFRVYEIYGLGAQFDFYWNPTTTPNDTQYSCFPDFYQMVIHHVIKSKSSRADGLDLEADGVLDVEAGDNSRIVFTNRADTLSYIMDLQQPGLGLSGADPNGSRGLAPMQVGAPNTQHITLQNQVIGGHLKKRTYVKINQSQYSKFSTFVNKIIDEKQRSQGFIFEQIEAHRLKQVKPTINNPESSRSILVYDFQIRKPGTDQFTPFLIYDLPGKEDLYKTFIEPNKLPAFVPDANFNSLPPIKQSAIKNRWDKKRQGSFIDMREDVSTPANQPELTIKERKSNYVMNPLMITSFDNNIRMAINYIVNKVGPKLHGIGLESTIIKEILNMSMDSYALESPLPFIIKNGNNFQIKALYDPSLVAGAQLHANPAYPTDVETDLTTFEQLFRLTSRPPVLMPIGTAQTSLLKAEYRLDALKNPSVDPNKYTELPGGPIVGRALILDNNLTTDDVEYNIYQIVMFAVMFVLIKYKFFDAIIQMINIFANGGAPLGSNTINETFVEGQWTSSKIYAFFEAFYINETISGILHYLVSDEKIVNRGREIFPKQHNRDKTASDTCSKYYKMHSLYKLLQNFYTNFYKSDPTKQNGLNINIPIDPEFLVPKAYTIDLKAQEKFIKYFGIYDKTFNPGYLYYANGKDETVDPRVQVPDDGMFSYRLKPFKTIVDTYTAIIDRTNKELYQSNAIFRDGVMGKPNRSGSSATCDPATTIINPNTINIDWSTGKPVIKDFDIPNYTTISNVPLIQEFIEPYKPRINNYYIFYLITNTERSLKAEEQLKLLDTSIAFINAIGVTSEKIDCP